MMRALLTAAALLAASPVAAQTTPAPVAAAAPDAARLQAATRLLDVMMPPATRQQMIRGMMDPLLANIRQGMTQNPDFTKMLGDDPRVAAAFDRFLAQQNARTVTRLQTSLPGMIDAMSRAYARRFDVTQLGELERFFRTPTGTAYMQASMTIMADPDIAAWQRTMMADAMGHVQEDAMAFAKEIAAIKQGETK
ncbi:DUF2059 domain-containing protein [Sphingomonas sp. KR1UV-12]|uniref:DUF2059 domain-containing protein n=1 Tax=Sphingomonas aurea TaxID=3063994 RepID=A0ABT9ELV6_9SPHN|nr:DUF2059 domain-containing protein [Sphingomonas sp. KR1UV-12]MDP1027921.1 DUF2059 domain-containing protein [Sphingomonas sp. KR1UV-12]